MKNNKKHFMGSFGAVDILEDFPRKNNNDLNPYTGISENNENIKLEIGLPKFDKKDITVTITDRIVFIQGVKPKTTQLSKGSKGKKLIQKRVEFKKSFRVPNCIETRDISVTYKDKILSLIMPKNNLYFGDLERVN